MGQNLIGFIHRPKSMSKVVKIRLQSLAQRYYIRLQFATSPSPTNNLECSLAHLPQRRNNNPLLEEETSLFTFLPFNSLQDQVRRINFRGKQVRDLELALHNISQTSIEFDPSTSALSNCVSTKIIKL